MSADREAVNFHQPQPVQKCACGADCRWCIGANEARAAFPKSTTPPKHDGDPEHHCIECFPEAARADGDQLQRRCHVALAGR